MAGNTVCEGKPGRRREKQAQVTLKVWPLEDTNSSTSSLVLLRRGVNKQPARLMEATLAIPTVFFYREFTQYLWLTFPLLFSLAASPKGPS